MSFHSYLVRIGLMATLFYCAACDVSQKSKKEQEDKETLSLIEPPIKVRIQPLELNDFFIELVSNGKLEGIFKAEMRFHINNMITAVFVRNGDYVKKGQLLAKLDDRERRIKLLQSKVSLDNAEISLTDYLIGQGYQSTDSATIPDEILQIAKIKSGYKAAWHNYELAKFNLSQCLLTAVRSGVVANMNSKAHTYVKNNEPFCLIIDNSAMEIKFPIMEPEAHLVQVGQTINIQPYYQQNEIVGKVTAVNPTIDEQGLIYVVAKIPDAQNLIDGMNIKVFVRKNIGTKLAVPKKAITLRSERPVVFVHKDGKALWNYVKTAEENSTHLVITDGLESGDQIIVEGNLHLAHKSRVELTMNL